MNRGIWMLAILAILGVCWLPLVGKPIVMPDPDIDVIPTVEVTAPTPSVGGE